MRTGPSDTFIAHKAINLADDLSGTEKRVAAAIIDHFNRKTGQCDPSLNSIAGLVGVSRRTVIRAIGTLVQKGYLDKTRHGGKFHRNAYLPIWSRFRAMETKWNKRRAASNRKTGSAEVSPLQGQACQLAGDADVPQTCPSNSLNLTSPAPRQEKQSPNVGLNQKRLSREDRRDASQTMANERFHVKPASSRVAAHDAAERRWMTALTTMYVSTPNVFATLLEAIDAPLSRAATALEMHKHGSGLHYVLEALRNHLPPTATTTSSSPTAAIGSSCEQSNGEGQ